MARNVLSGRCMFIWKLAPVVKAEVDVPSMVRKAKAAKLSGIWIKVADGTSTYENVQPKNIALFKALRNECREAGISVWGWQVPHGGTLTHAKAEGELLVKLAVDLDLDGVLMDAEAGEVFFTGTDAMASAYSKTILDGLKPTSCGLAMCGNDIPTHFKDYPFEGFVKNAQFNAPQVYYGSSPSVAHRLNRAIEANKRFDVPMFPVGAGWVGDGGGCASASACAERAREFIRLTHEHGYAGYSFWHWMGAPAALWEVLMDVAA
ncbi:hypothetical protein QTH97_34310 [Variovorax sp. J22R24]|uniref:hypothetical protein n=1 Tax=Variovorax gracilis TaxID=3053502 RepID=UPI002576FBEB|nr:hypothetical protein [Variovorax sp. J22R24]MDM0110022.1 hypothetical protein [Variovorax sp. J22R24]